MTSTPSSTASLIAATLSELKQPSGIGALPVQQTLYMAIFAPGAIPEPVPIVCPSMLIVDAVVPGGGRRGVRPVAGAVTRRLEVCLVDVLAAEARRSSSGRRRSCRCRWTCPSSGRPCRRRGRSDGIGIPVPPLNDGFSGQMPVSMTPMTRPAPALGPPPSCSQMPPLSLRCRKAGDSVVSTCAR